MQSLSTIKESLVRFSSFLLKRVGLTILFSALVFLPVTGFQSQVQASPAGPGITSPPGMACTPELVNMSWVQSLPTQNQFMAYKLTRIERLAASSSGTECGNQAALIPLTGEDPPSGQAPAECIQPDAIRNSSWYSSLGPVQKRFVLKELRRGCTP